MTLSLRMLLIAIMLGSIFHSPNAFGQLLVENFDYGASDNADITVATSNWARHGGTQGPAYSAAGLSYTGYASSGIGGSLSFTRGSSGVNDGDVNRTFTEVNTTGIVYFSFLVQLDSARSTADYFFHIGQTSIGTTFRGRVFARTNDAGWSLGLSKSSETRTDDNTVLSFGQTYLMVLKYSFNTTSTSDDEVTLYCYSSGVPASEPGTPLVTIGPLGSGTTSDPSNIGSVAIRQGTNTPSGRIDGIRVGTNWASAPLPVQLASFTASRLSASSAQLNWRTISETNNFGFFVQRKSQSESAFLDIPGSFIPGNGTTSLPQSYTYTDNGIGSGSYQYRLRQVDLNGDVHFSDPVQMDGVTGAGETTPAIFALHQNYPNPFNPATTIRFTVERSGPAVVRLYNMLGQEVRTLFSGNAETGREYSLNVDATGLMSGVYFYKLETSSRSALRKFTVLK